jgi:uncharacterized protein (DUF1330 family)
MALGPNVGFRRTAEAVVLIERLTCNDFILPPLLSRDGELRWRSLNRQEFEMAGYLIANIDVKDPEKFEEYRQKVMPVIKKFGGRYLIRGGDVRRLEGNLPLKRVVVLEFPTVEAAQQFYDSTEYQPILNLRLASTQSDVVLVQGY